VEEVLKEHAIDVRAVKAVATIDIKKEEEAIKNLIGDWKLEERFYSAEELKKASGEFHESSFVKDTVGVGNVCERAASLGGGSLIIRKQAGDGITVAAALEMPQLFDTDCLF
jgi:cobalt-precorrin 5A hydrolase